MCYPCTKCGRCGKYREDSPYYTPLAEIPCFVCGGVVDSETGQCLTCGAKAFVPAGVRLVGNEVHDKSDPMVGI